MLQAWKSTIVFCKTPRFVVHNKLDQQHHLVTKKKERMKISALKLFFLIQCWDLHQMLTSYSYSQYKYQMLQARKSTIVFCKTPRIVVHNKLDQQHHLVTKKKEERRSQHRIRKKMVIIILLGKCGRGLPENLLAIKLVSYAVKTSVVHFGWPIFSTFRYINRRTPPWVSNKRITLN